MPQQNLHIQDNFTADMMVAGVDEAGRGPLAGPVVAAAVVLDPGYPIDGLADSKTLSAATRDELAEEIRCHALAWALGSAGHQEIDQINILAATMLAMQRAVAGLRLTPRHVLVDGNRCPDLPCPATAIVKGDSKVAAISAASILAKVARDNEMQEWDKRYPQYGFTRHKGYPTRAHVQALQLHGPCECHRHSFAPVRKARAAGIQADSG